MVVKLIDLVEGRRAKIRPSEFAALRGCSIATLSRERWQGSPIPFEKDENSGRVLYDAIDVLNYLNNVKHTSTSEYSHDGNQRMEKARAAWKTQRTAGGAN